jgi:hypothetical protein
MNCQTAKENINLYIDGMISSPNLEELMAHIESCQDCKRELDDMVRLKKALAFWGDVQPPSGLAAESARKARKRHGVPIAYISAGVAAVLALAVILTTGILPLSNGDAQASPESVMIAAPQEAARGIDDSVNEAPAASEAPMEDSATKQAPLEEMAPTDGISPQMSSFDSAEESAATADTGTEQGYTVMEAPEPDCIVYVPADRQTDIKASLDAIIAEYSIEVTYLNDEAMDTYSFILPEAAGEEVATLAADLKPEGDIIVNQLIEFRFIK